jgi:hypothetical protein
VAGSDVGGHIRRQLSNQVCKLLGGDCARERGGKEDKPGFVRELVIDLDKPDVATVYMIAGET